MWRMDGSLFTNETEFLVLNHTFFVRGTASPYKKHHVAQDASWKDGQTEGRNGRTAVYTFEDFLPRGTTPPIPPLVYFSFLVCVFGPPFFRISILLLNQVN